MSKIKYGKGIVITFVDSSIQVKILKSNLRYFGDMALDELKERLIEVTGVIKKRNKKRILYLSHPSQLEIIPINKIKPSIKWSIQK